jgi:transcription termination/antitermination protein NusG
METSMELTGCEQPVGLEAPDLNQRDHRWWVLHTKARQEKAVAEAIGALSVKYFLPLVQHVRVYGKRKAVSELPLFPGYVFLRGTIDHAYALDRTDRIAQIIHVADQAQLDWELTNLKLALEQRVPLDPFPYLKKGIRAEVRSGPMRGLRGIIEDRTQRHRLILQVEMLGRAVSIEIDGALLEPME